ncbi:MAG: hypothetical protein PHQ96_03330 [Candidatus Omnitrophica bacterium]|nr:hypothetical protein [Candidatus Omnitrophota bacterium]
MKNARRMLTGCYILIPVFFFLSLCGCEQRHYRRDNREYDREYDREYRHYYREGRWYRHDSLGHDIAVAVLAIGALIESLPPQHKTVVVQGTPYYHDERYYYRQAPNGGYVVVPPPAIAQPRSKGNYDHREDRGANRHN